MSRWSIMTGSHCDIPVSDTDCKKTVMKTIDILREYLFPPFCPGCREVFRHDNDRDSALCPVCRVKWEQEKMQLCPVCGNPYPLCRCMPKMLEKAEADALLKLAPYRGDGKTIVDMTVLYMKTQRDRRVYAFVARQLESLISEYLSENGLDTSSSVLTYAPRRISAVNLTGFDQAKLLCIALSKLMKIPVVRSAERIPFSGTEQKKSGSSAERVKNAEKSFRPVSSTDLTGKTVFLLDDIVTTGASMTACTDIAKNLGAKSVIAVCIACTEREEKS